MERVGVGRSTSRSSNYTRGTSRSSRLGVLVGVVYYTREVLYPKPNSFAQCNCPSSILLYERLAL